MTQRISDQKDLPQKQSTLIKEEEIVSNLLTDKSKAVAEEEKQTLHTAKSKIFEKDAGQPFQSEEDDTLGSLQATKVSGTKVSKYARYKKPKPKESSLSDIDVTSNQKPKPEPSEFVIKQEESHGTVESMTSKTSVAQEKPVMRESLGQLSIKELEKQGQESVRKEKESEGIVAAVDNIAITKEDVQQSQLSIENAKTQTPTQAQEPPDPELTNLSVYERGNYMTNVVPSEPENPPTENKNMKNPNEKRI